MTTRLPGAILGKPTALMQIDGVIPDPESILRREAKTQGIVRIISNLKEALYPEDPYQKEVGLREVFNAITRREAVPDLMVPFLKRGISTGSSNHESSMKVRGSA